MIARVARVHALPEMAKELRRMRFSKLLLTASVAGLSAFAAVAQQPDQSDEQPPAESKAEPSRGLSDLEETVNQLLEDEVDPISRPSDEPRVPDRLPPEPEASRAPPEPALEPRPSEPSPAEPPVEASEPVPGPRISPPPPPPEPAPQPRPEAPRTAAAVTTAANAPATPPRLAPPLTRTELAALDRTAERGRLLIAIARAGILATQDMLTRISDPEGAGISGWIARARGQCDGRSPSMRAARRRGLEGRLPGQCAWRPGRLARDLPRPRPSGARPRCRREWPPPAPPPRGSTIGPARRSRSMSSSCRRPRPARRSTSTRFQRADPARPLSARRQLPDDDRRRRNRRGNPRLHQRLSRSRGGGADGGPAGAADRRHPPARSRRRPKSTSSSLLWSGHPLLVAAGEPRRIWQVTGDRIAEVRQ